ncbi:beta-ketoacyl synthase chain length factor [Arenimonas oryziterrae]|nr:beta-ketoacyl synthase chain length factor [Arenimonas oryziterrae]
MKPHFLLKDWHAFAPGLTDRQAWLDWARQPHLPKGEDTPALAEMPAMQRRRVENLGRMALQVAYWCQVSVDTAVPLVFASRHGDLSRTYEMLDALARDEALSPTNFGLSTHNAIAAQYSIARKLTGNYSAVSAGAASAEAAVIEALGLLSDGAEEVLIAMYDGCPPDAYAPYADEPAADYAWALRIAAAQAGDAGFSLDGDGTDADGQAPTGLPHGLEVLRFLLSDDAAMEFHASGRCWRWQRHA